MNARARRAVLPCALSALLSWTASLQAQNRFELPSRDGIAQVPDVSIDTFRDRRTASCFAVFSAGPGPSGAPPVAHLRIVSFSADVSRRSLRYVPYAGSACQGGIDPSATFAAIARAYGRASAYVRSGIGPISPGRWQFVQFL